ncbi:hypothetical protein O1611_g2909 [Lasiodiplodia mahajangana]|uniref:Uncharacterized protein n=1 Tax=Lasiodiplodia mahajangana TaxID=1108764 RepID=A0ACC2JT80_9PEZI|nr:hypothetical protein O1611_g2909 [Lasiodiplodia mahajangana]
MPITPSRLDLWLGHERNGGHCGSLSQVSGPKLPPNYENHSQNSLISPTPINSLHPAQGRLSREWLQSSQQPQGSENMLYPFEPTELLRGISDLPNGGDSTVMGMAAYRALSPTDTPDSMVTSLTLASLSELNSSPEVTPPMNERDVHGVYCEDSELAFNQSFDEWFPLDQTGQYEQNSQPSALNFNNKAGKLPEPSPIAQSLNFLTSGFHEEEPAGRKQLSRLNMDDIKPPLGESTDGSSLSNSTPWSADESTTPSDYGDDIAFETTGDILEPLIEPLLQKLLSAFSCYTLSRKHGEGQAKESNNSGVPKSTTLVATGKQTAAVYQHPRNSNSAKRKRQDLSQNSGNGEDDDEDEDLPPRKRTEPFKEDGLLACPFAKWKPLSYHSCHKYIMKDIRRVKQHLRRSHKRPLHCPTCWENFKVEETFYAHIGGRSCLPQPKTELEGVTATQQEHLERKVDRKLSRSDQWYSIFLILFPDSPRPRSAYLESDLSAELLDFQKFMAKDGLDIVEQTVHEQIPASLIPQTEELVTFSQALFQQAIPEILKKYEATRPHNSSPDSGYASLSLSSGSHSILDKPKVDELMGMEPIFETINPTPEGPALADYVPSCASNYMQASDYNLPDFLESTMGFEQFFGSDPTWGEGVSDNYIVETATRSTAKGAAGT